MKWETVSSTIGHSVFALWNNGRKLATLVFHSSSNAARIEYGNEKRVILIRDEGFRKNRTVLRSEYGIRIGSAGFENNEPYIELNDERYFYSLDEEKEPSLTIYKDSVERPLAVCGLKIEDDLLSRSKTKKTMNQKTLFSLLFGLCCYLFKPVESERQLNYNFQAE